MKRQGKAILERTVVGLIFCAMFFFPSLCLAESLELLIKVPSGSFSKAVTVRSQPNPFTVTLKNNSSSSQSVYWEADAGGIVNLAFEFSEEGGGSFVVKHRKVQTMSTAVVNSYLASGASIDKTIIADPDTWENVPVIEPGKVKEYRVRAVYDNNGRSIYSDYYTVIFDGGN